MSTLTALVSNGDLIQTPVREAAYMGIDALGAGRQGFTIVGVGSQLSHASAAISTVASAAIPVGLCLTGAACMITAAAWTIPDAVNGLKSTYKELETAEASVTDLDQSEDSLLVDRLSAFKAVEEAKTALPIAKLGVANQSLYLAMGAAQAAAGVVDIISPTVAHAFHFTPVLTGTAAATAATAAGVALGAVYVVRGGVMMTKSVKSYCIVRDFENEFKTSVGESIEKAVTFMEDSKARGETYLGRRVDAKCLTAAENGTDIEKLQAFDKGIYTEKLKHKIAIAIAAAMIIGGVLAIVAACLIPGVLPVLIISLVSAAFFLSVESVFFSYDSSRIFEWLRDHLYKESPYLTAVIKGYEDRHSADQQAITETTSLL